MSRVDVIVPCYKYGHYLSECVESVLSQGGVDVRVLILDDASPDQTPEVGTRLAGRDSRVEYRRHAVNSGHIATYNEGLAWATGEYLLLLSADDLLIPGALARAARLMDGHPEVGLTCGRQVVIRSDGPLPPVPAVHDPEEWTIISGEAFIERMCRLSQNLVPTPTAVVRTAVQRQVGGYRPELPHSGDMEMWLRFGACAAVGIVNAYQAYYRKHGANMVLSYSWPEDFEQRQAAFDSVFREYRDRLARCDEWAALAHHSLAEAALRRASGEFEEGRWTPGGELMGFAEKLWPAATSSPLWGRLCWKQRLRPIWPLLRVLLAPVRKRLSASLPGGRARLADAARSGPLTNVDFLRKGPSEAP